MSAEIVSILVLAGIFLIATVRSINLGALAIVAAFLLGITVLDGADVDERTDAIFAGFPGDLFIILVGVTYLFAIAKQNGTVDWIVQAAIRAAGGRIGLIPWIMFVIPAFLTGIGAVVPAAVAIIAPIGTACAIRYKINPLLIGLMVICGSTAGGFSPISVFGGITNGVVDKAGLPGNPTYLFLTSLVFNLVLALIAFFRWGGTELLTRRAEDLDGSGSSGDGSSGDGSSGGREGGVLVTATARGTDTSGTGGTTAGLAPDASDEATTLDRDRVLTLTGLVSLAVGALLFDLNVGLVAITVATVLTLISPGVSKDAVNHIAWPTVLLVCGIVLYVGVLQEIGTITWLGDEVAGIGTPLLAALVICFIGGVVSAFASTTGILGALIPLAVPFLTGSDAVGTVGLIAALAVSSSVVDSSPFSTSGALVVANTPEEHRDDVYRGLIRWGFSMVLLAPITTWGLLVAPGWL